MIIKIKKRDLSLVTLFLILTLSLIFAISVPLIYAETVNDTNASFIVQLAISNRAPMINVSNASGFRVDPVAGEDVKVIISFNVTDPDGVEQINATTAVVNFTLGDVDGQWRSNVSDGSDSEFGTCKNRSEGGAVIINCTVTMKYYDNASNDWYINISVKDTEGGVGRNNTQYFIYNELSSIDLPYESTQLSGATTNFSTVSIGEQNVRSYPHLVINHTGNDDFNMINITGSGLIGTTDSSKSVAITYFGVNLTNMSTVDGDVNKRLTFPSGGTAQLTDPDCVDSDPTNCNATLQHGDPSALTDYNDVVISAKGNVSVFFWVDVPESGLTPQLYNNTWNVTVSTDNT